MTGQYVVIAVAAIASLVVCACQGQVTTNNRNSSGTEIDDIIQCLNDSVGLYGACYNAAVITANDETKFRDHCATTNTPLSGNLEIDGCNATNVKEILRCLCPNLLSVTNINITTPIIAISTTSTTATIGHASIAGSAEIPTTLSASSYDDINSLDVITMATPNAVRNFTDFIHSLNVSDECKAAVLNITSSETTSLQQCLKLKAVNGSLADQNCSTSDYGKISAGLCLPVMSTHPTTHVVTTQRQIVTLFAKIVVNTTLQNKIWSYINNNLSSTCRYSIHPRVSRTITDLRRPCKMFRQSGEALMANRICSGEEVTTLTNIFCYAAFHGTQIPDTEDGRRELAFFLIAHGLTPGCHSVLQPQVEQFQESIAKGCMLLTAAKDLLVQTRMCTEMDIAKLDPVVCYVEPVKDNSTTLSPEGQVQRDKMEILVKQMSENCSGDIHSRFREVLDLGSEDACHVVSKSRDAILSNSSCTEQELSSLSKSVCSGSKVVTTSLTVLLITLFLSVVESEVFS